MLHNSNLLVYWADLTENAKAERINAILPEKTRTADSTKTYI